MNTGTGRVVASIILVVAAYGAAHHAPGTGTVQAAARQDPRTDPPAPPATPAPPTGPATPEARPTASRDASSGADATTGGRPVDCRRAKCVALTFDDGPGPYTGTLLRHLAAHHAHATFFVVGQNVAARPSVLRGIAAAGHEIGNHTWSHPDLTKLPMAAVRAQVARCDRAVRSAAGISPALVRPPYGALDTTVRAAVRRPLVLWSVDTLDWLHRDSARVARVAIKGARPGAVILFHDIHPTTVRAIPKVLKALSREGYTFVTVSRLFGGHPPRLVYGAPHQL
ncbi:polysaccharide deacetylase family protein [Nonomuraea sp. NPDC050783]|uniref:polysaccharide deacetylase family protein n=1 Tax=Nonomuraea sp. NPDC050783 TaxID=3154634 RepID=UPI003466FCA7